jgi:hypothetical protein
VGVVALPEHRTPFATLFSGFKFKDREKIMHHNSNSKQKPAQNVFSGAGSGGGYSNNSRSSFSFNNGKVQQPCVRAYQQQACDQKSVPLSFNFWMQHSHLLDKDVQTLIQNTLVPSKVKDKHLNSQLGHAIQIQDGSALPVSSSDASDQTSVVVLVAHGLDPSLLNDYIQELPFLKTLSSMPVKHLKSTALDTQQANVSSWQYMDVDCCNSQILWTERSPISLHEQNRLSTLQLLLQCSLVFMVR